MSIEEKEKQINIKMIIDMAPDGKMSVTGPGNNQLFDEPLCLWLLDKAKDFIKIRNSVVQKSAKPSLYVPRRKM